MAADPGDLYLQFYFQLQEAQKSEKSGDASNALRLYQLSYSLLNRIKEDYPDWRPDLINYRGRFCRERINALRGKSNALTPSLVPSNGSSEEVRNLRETLMSQENQLAETRKTLEQTRISLADLQKELNESRTNQATLQKQLQDNQAERETLQSQLATAQKDFQELSSQTTDSRVEKLTTQLEEAKKENQQNQEEQAKLLEKISLTEKEIAALKTGSQVSKEADQNDLTALKETLNEKEKQLAELQEQLEATKKNLETSQQEIAALRAGEMDQRVTQLLEENAQLNEKLKIAAAQLTPDTNTLSNPDIETLKNQLESIKQQLISAETQNAEYEKTVSSLREQLNAQKEKFLSMELTLQQTSSNSTLSAQANSLQQENEVLRNIIDRQMKEEARREAAKKIALEELKQLKVQSQVLTKQIEILASPTLMLSENELALLQQPAPTPIASHQSTDLDDEIHPTLLPPRTMEATAKEAKAFFNTKNYEKAEEKFQEILDRYPDNVYALSNLGVVYFQQAKYKEAEATLSKAVKYEPNDGFSHSILGIVYYMTQRYDDAINTLTRAVTLDPKDPQTRNYLGIACSQKGWLSVAEQEIRKALEINPNYGEAHFNLAVIYASQKPPAKEIANQHYQQAMNLGVKADKNLEKMLQ
ncbi:MAG: tetratricopeptide repeat protein [Verrucomicrobiae bacterium]|nr:tetratricopeptide repeat protein [Verrucomicrobiae bacterium]